MQLASRTSSTCCTCSRPQRSNLRVFATAIPPSNIPPSPSSLDRPAGGGSRSFDLPRSSDITYSNWGPSSDMLRPSNGANRGTVFAAASSSIDRPGGRGGRADMPAGTDIPTPQDPALGRPGGRGGRDLSIEGGSAPSTPQDPALSRPGGRGGRDFELSGSDVPTAPVNIDRPGGRGGREEIGGGGSGGDSGNDDSSGGSGGSGDGGSGDGGSSGSGDEGFSFGKGVGSVALYAGVIAAAWAGHKAFFAKPAAEEPPQKSCCSGKAASSKKK